MIDLIEPIAVKADELVPDVSHPAALKAALLGATGIYFPDPVKATAGIHSMKVLKALGIEAEVADRLRPFPNGATAMREMTVAWVSANAMLACVGNWQNRITLFL